MPRPCSDDAATEFAAGGIVGVVSSVGLVAKGSSRRASRRKNFLREKRRATAREHFRRAAVSGMIKNGAARYKKINTFHYRNPGNGTEHLSHRLHYERKKARERGRAMSRQASRLFSSMCLSGRIKILRRTEEKVYRVCVRLRAAENRSRKYSGSFGIIAVTQIAVQVDRVDLTRAVNLTVNFSNKVCSQLITMYTEKTPLCALHQVRGGKVRGGG